MNDGRTMLGSAVEIGPSKFVPTSESWAYVGVVVGTKGIGGVRFLDHKVCLASVKGVTHAEWIAVPDWSPKLVPTPAHWVGGLVLVGTKSIGGGSTLGLRNSSGLRKE